MIKIVVVQQSAWDIPMDSMPLAAGYLKAIIESDSDLAGSAGVDICNFRGGMSLTEMAARLFTGVVPDMLAFSVLGWNYRNFLCLAETYKQINPRGVVVFGGNHVAYQAGRVFRESAAVDLVVDGEGELTFRDLVGRLADSPHAPDFTGIAGLSHRDRDGAACQSGDRERVSDLDILPSPLLTGAVPLTGDDGRFRYEFALLETNRGCPYKCAFCYWGGAVGQRVRAFSRARLAAELDLLGRNQVHTVFLCDANFGMLEADEQFVDDLVATRERYGYPRALEANWAKNKSARFHSIVRTLKRQGFKSSFTLALQTLTDEALIDMNRRNMRLNQWEDLVDWLNEEDLECYAELIWGTPGDTPEQFLAGYDKLAERVPRIAVYPLLLLPNTAYVERRDLHGFLTVRGQHDDFEYVLASRSAGLPEHLRMQRFMYLARILGENQYFKRLWAPARLLGGLSQSRIVLSLLDWLDASADPAVAAFRESFPVLAESPAVARGHRMLYENPLIDAEIERWWRTVVVSQWPAPWREFGEALYRFERLCRPVYAGGATSAGDGWHERDGEYVSDPVVFPYAMQDVLDALPNPPVQQETAYRFTAPHGFYDHLDNHETGAHYFATATVVSEHELTATG
nr:KedN5 family methylcobalamin-dependent radical SAM C-methyltransferase [Kibdelosporangium sp. MJ126-NF4]CEL15838.1 Radical SAM domain protein [Kibdelosporangium sp. MJ126-NF4]CTQ93763.1 Radical SAM domain protein [Kibdelosporangium sp. MJ126-NF4]